MDGVYKIPGGQVEVRRQGLYDYFSCRCSLDDPGIHRLILRLGEREENLGVCMPMDGQFGVEKKLPASRLGEGEPKFYLTGLAPKEEKKSMFVPVYPEEPFAYLSRLEDAFLETQNGQIGVVLPEKEE